MACSSTSKPSLLHTEVYLIIQKHSACQELIASSFKGGGGLEENFLRGACKVSRGEAHQVAFVEAAGRFASAYEIGSVRLLLR